MTATKIHFETSPCGRCCGTGSFGPKMVEGGRCFQCKGAKQLLTARGRTARKRYDEMVLERLGAPIADLKPGDVIWASYEAWAGFQPVTSVRAWRTVKAVTLDESYTTTFTVDGVEKSEQRMNMCIEFVSAKGEKSTALNSTPEHIGQLRYPRYDAAVLVEIMTTVAARYKGAWLDGEQAPERPVRKPRTPKPVAAAEAAPKPVVKAVVKPLATNLYPGDCRNCGQHVEAKAGEREQVNGRWEVQHKAGECPAPEAADEPQDTPQEPADAPEAEDGPALRPAHPGTVSRQLAASSSYWPAKDGGEGFRVSGPTKVSLRPATYVAYVAYGTREVQTETRLVQLAMIAAHLRELGYVVEEYWAKKGAPLQLTVWTARPQTARQRLAAAEKEVGGITNRMSFSWDEVGEARGRALEAAAEIYGTPEAISETACAVIAGEGTLNPSPAKHEEPTMTQTATAETTVTIKIPGAFDAWFEGTGLAQGQDNSDPECKATYDAYVNRREIRAGRGYYLVIEANATVLKILAEYADYCLDANTDEPVASEIKGARTVIARVQAARTELTAAREAAKAQQEAEAAGQAAAIELDAVQYERRTGGDGTTEYDSTITYAVHVRSEITSALRQGRTVTATPELIKIEGAGEPTVRFLPVTEEPAPAAEQPVKVDVAWTHKDDEGTPKGMLNFTLPVDQDNALTAQGKIPQWLLTATSADRTTVEARNDYGDEQHTANGGLYKAVSAAAEWLGITAPLNIREVDEYA
jgi:hypothetical protein